MLATRVLRLLRLAASAVCLAGALSACVAPRPWAPPPPIGSGYAYRFEGVHTDVVAAGHDTWRVGNWRLTSYYGARHKGTSEREHPFERAARERYEPGTEADGRFNAHLGELGEKVTPE